MKHFSAGEIRSKYLHYFASKEHHIIPSSPLVPENDPTTLFTGSGMQPMLPYLLGNPHPLGKRLADSQKCFRAVDMEEVGDNRHTTFFEMLGNWSLGDYFKKEQIEWMWHFLIEELGLNPQNLYISCHAGSKDAEIDRDDFAANTWKTLFATQGISAEIASESAKNGIQPGQRIFYYEDKKNWWSRAGVPAKMPVGEPGGPDSEMFYDFDADGSQKIHTHSPWKDVPCHVNCDCGRFLEIGNNVFMAYKKQVDGSFAELAGKNIDFGGGLERIAMAIEHQNDIFLTEIFREAKEMLERLSGMSYLQSPEITRSFRIILDHSRAATFLLSDGVFPSNVDAGYFVRRLIRRSVRAGRSLKLQGSFLESLARVWIVVYQDHYPLLASKSGEICQALTGEEIKFEKTLERGEKEIEKILQGKTPLDGKTAFYLFETFGYPIEMTQEILIESRYHALGINDPIINVEIMKEKITERDTSFSATLEQFQQDYQTAAKHHSDTSRVAAAGKFAGGLADHSEATTALHSTCHLMLAGLRKVLGNHIHQAGSNITAERLRFDFTHPEKVTPDQLQQVENYVNEAIQSQLTVVMKTVPKAQAQAEGIEGSFWEKYPEVVQVYEMTGANGRAYSRELCGGPHVENSQSMGVFKIQKEESSSAGVRRIKAILQ